MRNSVLSILLFLVSLHVHGQTLNVAVAANFASPLRTIAPAFEQQHKVTLAITVASSGTLYAQISHGAPYAVFFSADEARPQALVSDARVLARDVFTYATGTLVYIDRDAQQPTLQNIQQRIEQRGSKLAIANPRLAPYGLAAQQLLEKQGLWHKAQSTLVMGKNIMQAFQYYQSGNVDAALVAGSLVADWKTNKLTIPANLYSPVIQQVAIIEAENATARALVAYVLSAPVQAQLHDAGYGDLTLIQANANGG